MKYQQIVGSHWESHPHCLLIGEMETMIVVLEKLLAFKITGKKSPLVADTSKIEELLKWGHENYVGRDWRRQMGLGSVARS